MSYRSAQVSMGLSIEQEFQEGLGGTGTAHRAATRRTASLPNSFALASSFSLPFVLTAGLSCSYEYPPSSASFPEPTFFLQALSPTRSEPLSVVIGGFPMRLAHPRNITLCELSLSAISILPGVRECWSCLVDNSLIPRSMTQNNEGSLPVSALYPAHSWLVWKSGPGQMERD